jgi:hypothetical protein
MDAQLDLDDVAATSELAKQELATLRADNQRMREALEVVFDKNYPAFESFSGDSNDIYDYAIAESDGEEWTQEQFREGALKMIEAFKARAALGKEK